MIISGPIRVAVNGIISFFFMADNILLHTYTTSALSSHLLVDIEVVSVSQLL